MNWTTPADLKTQVQKWWDRGELLTELLTAQSSFPRRLRLKTPASSEMADRFDEVRSWISALQAMPQFRIEMREFKHRVFGKNEMPAEIWLDKIEGALAVIGKQREARRFSTLIELTREREPQLLAWLQRRPLNALELYEDWDRLLRIVTWVKEHQRSEIYLRQVDVAGIHTKFIEAHRSVLSEWLDLVLPPESIDVDAGGINQFNRRYGFRDKPLRIRFRILDSKRSILPVGENQDITLDVDSFASLNPEISRVFITENEINFLSLPPLNDSMVIFGAGYGLDSLAQADWLLRCAIYYWGDIDTHGFAILSSARSHLPHVQSLLMDESTLLAHLDLVGVENLQHSAGELPHLTVEEQNIYRNLKQHKWGKNIRLEQERVSWAHVCSAMHLLSTQMVRETVQVES